MSEDDGHDRGHRDGGGRGPAGERAGRRGPERGDRGGYRGERDRPRREAVEGRPRRDDDRPRRERGEGRPRREDDRRRGFREARGGYRPESAERPRRYRDEDRPVRHREDGRPPRQRDPEIPEGVEARQLDKALRSELLTLSKDNAEGTARHLVAAGLAVAEDDLDAALAHAQAAGRRAGRVAGVRETLGVVHYRRGEWAKALAEFRTARRLSGLDHLLPLMADAERGLGRPERALELAATPEAARLEPAELIEMAIVVSGARADMGQTAAAVQHLRDLARRGSPKAPWAARLRYAYAAALEADGQHEEAQEWYAQAARLDEEGQTDAAELVGMEVEPELIDLGDDEDEDETGPGPGADGDGGGDGGVTVANPDDPATGP